LSGPLFATSAKQQERKDERAIQKHRCTGNDRGDRPGAHPCILAAAGLAAALDTNHEAVREPTSPVRFPGDDVWLEGERVSGNRDDLLVCRKL